MQRECSEKHCTALVVAHRETIRKLAGAKFPMPYCCTAQFTMSLDELPNRLSVRTDYIRSNRGTAVKLPETCTVRDGSVKDFVFDSCTAIDDEDDDDDA